MAIDKSKLKEFLDTQSLTSDEKAMWMTLGFYVREGFAHNNGEVRTPDGDTSSIRVSFSRTLRRSVIEWWELEKEKQTRLVQPARNRHHLDILETKNE